jgi:F-type H+-transporting ATPase subunit b
MFFINESYAAESEHTVQSETGVAPSDHKGVFPPFDTSHFASQFLWLAISFGVFYIFLARVITPRISSIIKHRETQIQYDLDEASKLKDASDNALRDYEKSLSSARADALKIGNEAQEKAKLAAYEHISRSQAELDAKLTVAEKNIVTKRDAAMANVTTIAQETTEAILKKITDEKFSTDQISIAIKNIKG